MNTQALINQVSDRNNNSIKKFAEKIVSNIDSVGYFRNDTAASSRLGVTIDWSKGTMLIDSNKK
jgi:hypothetical protein